MLPLYLEKLTLTELQQKAEALHQFLIECKICPNECMARREEGEKGECHSTDEVIISSIGPHFGEEPPLVGSHGSGIIFFTNCNLSCEFCQNYDISHLGMGEKASTTELAKVMLHLQQRGCHNINLVTPTHFTPQIVDALILAIEKGLELPIIYNCGGYESLETLKLLDDIVDIYMPDIKYSINENALKYSGVQNYWEKVKLAIKEMHRQAGDLIISKRGIAQRGLLVRHLVLPNDVAGSKTVVDFIADDISINTYLNIMDQYRPAYNANKYEKLNRRITPSEYKEVVDYAFSKGLKRGFEDI
ncbi:MAG: radical SAM protein [Ignavibacteria bacterium]|nr:radical SAM protein [Ignavibacteria bacterium]MBT8383542.1 radical SAM protein [Ignavibacteria bacterium]MBT8390491.1 radical SAM protein [Ignavibacteria bacterium]NNJ52561.1 radical SAM protein [Ignavibacteriaceae bacterium]NNL20044.1 radical SAM protein [Ignavibacteriaceae bacterium]